MYSRVDLSFVQRDRADLIWEALMGLRSQGRAEQANWSSEVREAYDTLERAFSRLNQIGTRGRNRMEGIGREAWHDAVTVAQDHLLGTMAGV